MVAKTLKAFLDKKHVNYRTIDHSVAYTAQETAELAHVSGDQLAKVVIVSMDGKDVMVVVSATAQIDLENLKTETKAGKVDLANESNFTNEFPDCELGAMPPFGNLYGMDVYVDSNLARQKEIVFNAGTHSESIQLAYRDFEKMVKPKKLKLVHK